MKVQELHKSMKFYSRDLYMHLTYEVLTQENEVTVTFYKGEDTRLQCSNFECVTQFISSDLRKHSGDYFHMRDSHNH